MQLAEILKQAGRNRKRKRLGRGPGSGLGKTAGRGHKGAGSRAGSKRATLSEGGQMPLFRRVPKRGFNNAPFRTVYNVVNVGDLEGKFESGAHVTGEAILEAGLIRNLRFKVKVLGNGDLTKKFKVEAAKFSKSAEEKIKAAGGEAVVI
ncbi:MAG TPA: 50S ribosomal protein L15 [Phycisphaerae bacterium]|nr:50S ribosomal protein L15 [Phycisphaerales bacterium]HRX85803.1 50S ribosomal protein L15 [Phycisphaerae bacterium]